MAEIRLDLRDVDGYLPEICMCCGAEATTTKTRKMAWCPTWVSVLIIAGWLPYLVVAMVLTKRATVQVPLCDQHKGHWFNRGLLMAGSFFLFLALGVGVVVLAIALDPRGDNAGPFAALGCVLLFVAWIVVLVVAQNTAIRPKEITDHEIVLQGVSSNFVDAFEDFERERRARRKKRRQERDEEDEEEEEEEEEPRPRKKTAASDGIQEKKRRPAKDEIEEQPRPRKKRPAADEDE